MVESAAPWLCSGSSESLSSRAENWSGKPKDAGLSVSEQRAPGEKSTGRKCRADGRADSRTKALCRSAWSVEVSGVGLQMQREGEKKLGVWW